MKSLNEKLKLPHNYRVDDSWKGLYRFNTMEGEQYKFEHAPLLSFYTDDYEYVYVGKWGCVDDQGKVVIEAKYNYFVPFNFVDGEHAIVAVIDEQNNLKCGLIDLYGNVVIPLIYPQLHNVWKGCDEALAFSRDGRKYGLMDYTGKVIIEPRFIDILDYDPERRLIVTGERDFPFDPPRGLYSMDLDREVLPARYPFVSLEENEIECERYYDFHGVFFKYENLGKHKTGRAVKPFIDIHSHILPGEDDGCPNKDEALAMLRMYEDQGAKAVICTPQLDKNSKTNDINRMFEWLCSVESAVKLYMGKEVRLPYCSLRDLRQLAGSDRILIELDEHTEASEIKKIVCKVADSGYVPVLANAERYQYLRNDLDLYYEIMREGAEFQIDVNDLREDVDERILETTRYLLEKRLANYIGSDAHGEFYMPPWFVDGVKWIYDHCPEEYADAVVHDNAAKLIG